MEPMEVIDLSSDDENSPPKKQETGSSVTAKKQEQDNKIACDELEIIYNVTQSRKRTIDKTNENSSKTKRIKLSKEKDHSEIVTNLFHKKSEISLHKITKIKPQTLSSKCTTGLFTTQPTTGSDYDGSFNVKINGSPSNSMKTYSHSPEKPKSPNSRNNTNSFKINEGASSSTQITKPHLMVKRKINVCETMESVLGPSTEVIELFLDACRSQDPSEDMERIISKLKKRYNNLDPSYAKSGSFIQLIRQKRNLVLNNRAKLYLHISEVMDEMKARQLQHRSSVKNKEKSDTKEEDTPVRPELSNIAEEVEISTPDQDALAIEDSRTIQRLAVLEKAMRRCERRIIKCENTEVDFNDENDSHYILAEKYKHRMVELYNKYCEITGEKPDAARPYLRPKYLSVTPIPSLNNAITSFINMKIGKINQKLVHMKKNSSHRRFTDALIFPDYVDVLNCIKKCNDDQNLQLNKAKQESIAKEAFSTLGAHLQRCRQLDYYDTFSLYLEKEGSDPALSDKSLAEKLNANQEMGKKRMDQLLQDFVEKENTAKATENGSCLEKEEDPETGDESSNDTDDENSDVSEDEKISIGVNSDSGDNEVNDTNAKPQDNLDQKDSEDVKLKKPQDDLNQEGNDVIEPEKPQEDLVQKADEDVELDKMQVALNLGSDDGIEAVKPQGDLNQKDDDVERNNDVGTNVEINETKEPDDGLDSVSIEKIDEKSIEIDTDKPVADRVMDDVEITVENDAEMTSTHNLEQAEIICVAIKRISIDQEPNKTEDPSDTEKTAPLPSIIQEPESAVATCKVNLMQANNILEMDLSDRCSPVIPANTTNVIDAPAVATTVEPIGKKEEKKPILRLRQFAKPPGSWKDFQSPTKESIENTDTAGGADANSESIKMKKTLPAQHQSGTLIKLNPPNPVVKSVQLRNDILLNLRNKKSTVIIPPNLNRSIPQINLKTVTNNVTFNFNNQAQTQPKGTIISHGVNPAQNVININSSGGRVITRCNNVGVFNNNSDKNNMTQKCNPSQTVGINSQPKFLIKRPTSQVCLVGQESTRAIAQSRVELVPSKSTTDQQRTIVRNIPSVGEHGKRTIYRLVKHSPGSKGHIIVPREAPAVQNERTFSPNQRVNCNPSNVANSRSKGHIIVPTKAPAVQNERTFSPNQRANCNPSNVANSDMKFQISNSIKNILTSKVPGQPNDKVDKVYEAPINSVPTYDIE